MSFRENQTLSHRSISILAALESGDEFGKRDQTEGVYQQRLSGSRNLCVWWIPGCPLPGHRERAKIGVPQAQHFNARGASNLQNDKPMATQGVKRVDDFSQPQTLTGRRCSSPGA